MDRYLKRAARELRKIAADIAAINNIEDQLGANHPGSTELDPSYERVETRLYVPSNSMLDWMRSEGMMEDTDENSPEDLPMSYEQVVAEANGLNKRYEYPSTPEYQDMMGRAPRMANKQQQKLPIVRKTTIAKMEQAKKKAR